MTFIDGNGELRCKYHEKKGWKLNSLQLHGDESFLGSQQLLSHPNNSQYFMKIRDSLLSSDYLITYPHPELHEYTHLPMLFLLNSFCQM
jgi:hypothetical protein